MCGISTPATTLPQPLRSHESWEWEQCSGSVAEDGSWSHEPVLKLLLTLLCPQYRTSSDTVSIHIFTSSAMRMYLLFTIVSLKVPGTYTKQFRFSTLFKSYLFQAFGLCSPSAVGNDVRVKRLLSDPDDPRFAHQYENTNI